MTPVRRMTAGARMTLAPTNPIPADLPRDRVGREVHIGDFIVYAGQRGDSACLNFGKVVGLPVKARDELVTRGGYDNGTYTPPVYKTIPYFKIQVQPWDFETGEPVMERRWISGKGYSDESRPCRKVTLEFHDRVAVIENI